jgi:cyclic pyranopterin phosphate synthase
MVDVAAKAETHRVARATGLIRMLPATFALIAEGQAKKGDVIGIARIAAIQGAKRTAELVPLCHPLPITRVAVDFELDRVPPARCAARPRSRPWAAPASRWKPSAAVQVGLLTVYDMCKAADRGMVISDVQPAGEAGRQVGSLGGGRRSPLKRRLQGAPVGWRQPGRWQRAVFGH